MERGEVDLLGGDELVAGALAQVFDVVDEERVGELVLGEQDELGAAGGEAGCDLGADARGAALCIFLSLMF